MLGMRACCALAINTSFWVWLIAEFWAIPPLHLGDITEEELWAYNGSDSQKPLLMAIKEHIYDVSTSKLPPLI
ncbi:hypothetical protein RND71_014385 [Anisodus tanguticus]|uniref:Uncharacterized protein n=1 Tax=Anisodus tanguticus TaxID=243964 RepID=A0AAE1VNL3_9SOLA|nr:hypothetical protein RND71_014385 [Anisodus tanguticus]